MDDARLAEDLTLRGIAVEGIFDLGAGNGSIYEMDITTNRVDAMNHYGVAREAAAIYGLALAELSYELPEARPPARTFRCGSRRRASADGLRRACCVELRLAIRGTGLRVRR